MASVTLKTRDGGPRTISAETITALRGALHGALCLPGEPGYDLARTIWNGMIDRRPAAIVRAAGAADVIRGVDVAGEQDLVLGVRGGGGNFGVVTSFEFRLHPVGPDVLSGLIVHPLSRAVELLDGYRRIAASAPDELACWFVMRKAPPLPFLPPEYHGKEILVFAA